MMEHFISLHTNVITEPNSFQFLYKLISIQDTRVKYFSQYVLRIIQFFSLVICYFATTTLTFFETNK